MRTCRQLADLDKQLRGYGMPAFCCRQTHHLQHLAVVLQHEWYHSCGAIQEADQHLELVRLRWWHKPGPSNALGL